MPSAAQRSMEESFDDAYTCDEFCSDLPYTFWNTCPLCVCGLVPVLVVCFSAAFRLDYATHVTDIGAQIINEIGLSYTVYYTAGCWPKEPQHPALADAGFPGGPRPPAPAPSRSPQCNGEHFEIAAGEFDAMSGSLLKVQNVTKLHARRVDAVKVSPDWRYIIFVGSLANDIGNLYAVGAEQREAEQAVPLLTEEHLHDLDARCQRHSAEVLEAAQAAPVPPGAPPRRTPAGQEPKARLAGFKHLQVIIPGVAPIDHGSDLDSPTMPQPTADTSLVYRAAFAFECAEASALGTIGGTPTGTPLRFSKLAVVDFQLQGLNLTSPLNPLRSAAYAESELTFVDAVALPPKGAVPEILLDAVVRLKSQSCPRFVPSRMGQELLFVAEDPAPGGVEQPAPAENSWVPAVVLQSRWLAITKVPVKAHPSVTQPPLPKVFTQTTQTATPLPSMQVVPGRRLANLPHQAQQVTSTTTSVVITTTSSTAVRTTSTTSTSTTGVTTTMTSTQTLPRLGPDSTSAVLLEVGEGALPRAAVRGCPEFVPSLARYVAEESLADQVKENWFQDRPTDEASAQLAAERRLRDTFVILSDPESESVLGIDAQVLAVSLPETNSSKSALAGEVSRVQLLYNVDDTGGGPSKMQSAGREQQLRLGGCQPIRAAGRKGHMRLQSIVESLMKTLQMASERSGYTAWLACLTADQRIAIVESPKREHWINMSMPYPMWTGRPTQDIWCPPGREESCFEVWSNPNPHA